MRRPAPLALALALVLAGCGGARERGTATLWVTRDRGAHVLYTGTVPAGLTAMQALERRADVKTRYGGRFVQAIDRVEGDASRQRDWFYFVNGIEADRGAAEYRLHAGDVEWWDYRSWKGRGMSVPVVVGAFPEPFLHGFLGKRRRAVVVGRSDAARKIARLIHATGGSTRGANVFRIRPQTGRFQATMSTDGRVLFVISTADAARLAANPKLARFHYEGLG